MKAGGNFYYKQTVYYRKNVLLLLGMQNLPNSPFEYPWYMQVFYFKSQCHYCAEYFADIEHLTDSYCIPSKTSANKIFVF